MAEVGKALPLDQISFKVCVLDRDGLRMLGLGWGVRLAAPLFEGLGLVCWVRSRRACLPCKSGGGFDGGPYAGPA